MCKGKDWCHVALPGVRCELQIKLSQMEFCWGHKVPCVYRNRSQRGSDMAAGHLLKNLVKVLDMEMQSR